jgi:uracil-DNA glycosylase
MYIELSREDLLEKLRKKVENCRKCVLWRTRNRPVFGEGPVDAGIMIVGLGLGGRRIFRGDLLSVLLAGFWISFWLRLD